MGKALLITEKPSVAREFAQVLKIRGSSNNGYIESERAVVTWCVGHLVSMSYPEAYDEKMKKWDLETIPFLPTEYKYEIIPAVQRQFEIVKSLLERDDIDKIYVCTDAGREGEYIYRLVDQMVDTSGKEKLRVWIDSQTEEEILRGIKEAKPLSEYDNLGAAAYLRAKEDYLMGINFSRALTLRYSWRMKEFLKSDSHITIAVGRVMTCVLGMIVKRERAIRNFVKNSFYRVVAAIDLAGTLVDFEWKAVEGSRYYNSPLLYKENGFNKEADAKELIASFRTEDGFKSAVVDSVTTKKETKKPPLFFNLAELQNICSKLIKISPDETLSCAQELYEKKMITYPRTDARVISTAVCKEIHKNIAGLKNFPMFSNYADEVLVNKVHIGFEKTKYVNDKAITDHYAIIPTGQGQSTYNSLSNTTRKVFDLICARFLSPFFPNAIYKKVGVTVSIDREKLFANFKTCENPGFEQVLECGMQNIKQASNNKQEESEQEEKEFSNTDLFAFINNLKKGDVLDISEINLKEGETTPPKRYNSGSLILAMENAGQLIEDEELREQIKGSGIGTSATRAEIIKKLTKVGYIKLAAKTQIVSPTQLGEMIFDCVYYSIQALLNPKLTASWEKGLSQVSSGEITEAEYMQKLEAFVSAKTDGVKNSNNNRILMQCYEMVDAVYK